MPQQLHALEQKLLAAWPRPAWCDVTVVAAVSGGPDSVALLQSLARLGASRHPEPPPAARLIAAHYNHRWRGPASDADEAFVRQLCETLHVPCRVARADVPTGEAPQSLGDGLEAAARDARYAFLIETARSSGARYVVTAHTADDQVETVLHRVMRGTGLSGLAGIPRLRPLCDGVSLVRPLLDVRRCELLDYLERLGQPHRADESNLDAGFTRVRIRRQLLPRLREQYNPQVDDALLRLGQLAAEAQSVVEGAVGGLFKRAVSETRHGVRIERVALQGVSPYLVRELLIAVWKSQTWPQQAMNYEKWDELAVMAMSPAPGSPLKRHFPGSVTAERLDECLLLSRGGKA